MTGLISAALAAGMVAAVNPCGFAMLPAYLGLFMSDQSGIRRSAVTVGLTVSLGFLIVFTIAGVLIGLGVGAVIDWIPWLAGLVGAGLIVAGIAVLRGAHLLVRLPGLRSSGGDGSFAGLVGFGASYAVASLSCTLPIFLSLIAGTLSSRSFAESVATFVAYGVGMSLTVIAVTIALAVGRDRIIAVMRPIAARLDLIGGWVLILAGGFVVWYWATVLSSGATALNANPAVGVIDQLSGAFARFVAARPVLVAVLIGAAIALTIALGARSRSNGSTDPELQEEVVTRSTSPPG
ncbi:MAG TPA: cytochrome c biogenesis CcdA family protein [Acidimicrobiia bacterium]